MATDAAQTNGNGKRAADEAPAWESSSKKALSTTEEAYLRLGFEMPKRNFTREDMKMPPWTDYTRAMFRAKNEMYDTTYASGYMRWWFDEHNRMPEPIAQPSRSAWRIYFLKRQKDLGFAMGGKKGAKQRKQVGDEWAALSDDDKQPYLDEHEKCVAKYDADVEKYEEELEAWQNKKKLLPPREDGQPRCNCEHCTGVDGLGPSAPVR